MDRERFDALARLFATTGSRRTAIGALVSAGVLGTGLGADARKGKNGNRRDKRKGKTRKKVRPEQVAGRCCSRNNCTPGKGKNLGKCCYEDRDFSGKNFSGANFGEANFTRTDLSNVNFHGANLGKACFVDSIMLGVKINGSTNTDGAIFCRTQTDTGEDNSGCDRGTPCCPTCDGNNLCDDGEVCCNGRCVPGDCCGQGEQSTCDNGSICCDNVCITGNCCAAADCEVQTCQRRRCVDDQCTYEPISGEPGPRCQDPRICCEGDCVDLETDEDHCGACGRECEDDEVCSNGLTCQGEACFPVTATSGDVTPHPDGGLTHTTEGAAEFGAARIQPPAGATFGQLATMESTFDFATGVCGAGAPRFVVFLTNGRCPYAAFPPGGDCADGQGTTGNLIGNNTPFVWNDDLCGGNSANNTYAEVLTAYSGVTIDRIALVVDESFGEQTVTLEPCVTRDLPG